MRLSLIILPLVGFAFVTLMVRDSEAVYPYAIKGFVKDVRHKPHLFIGAWALKKFIKLKLIKWKFILAKKLKIKKKIKAVLILALLKKLKKKVHRHFYHRRKRQVQDYVPYSPSELDEDYEYYDYQDLPGSEPADDEMMAYLSMASELDRQACLPKGVCEAVAKGNSTNSNHFDKMINMVFGEGKSPTSSTESSPYYAYEYAAWLGKSSGDIRMCEQFYPSCPEPPQSLNNFMETTFTSETCEFPDNEVNSRSDSFVQADADLTEQFYHQQQQSRQPQQQPQRPQHPQQQQRQQQQPHSQSTNQRPSIVKFANK